MFGFVRKNEMKKFVDNLTELSASCKKFFDMTNNNTAIFNNTHLQAKRELEQLRDEVHRMHSEVNQRAAQFNEANVRFSLVQTAMDRLTRMEGLKGFDQKKIVDLAQSLTGFVLTGDVPDRSSLVLHPDNGLGVVPFSRK